MTTRRELIEKYRALKSDAERFGYQADAAELFECVLEDLRELDGLDDDVPQLLTTEEAADRLGVTPATVAKYCREGKIPEVSKTGSDGGEWRIPASSLTHSESGVSVSSDQKDETDEIELGVSYEEGRAA